MRLHRFIGNFDLSQKQIVINDADFINQAKNVLRLKVGDELILCDGKMNETHARFTELGSSASKLEVLEIYKNENEPENYVVLYCPVLKKENFELAVQKAVEVGVKEIAPVITARTVKLGLSKERLEKIIKEAAEQSGRGVLPVLRNPVSFDEAVNQAKNSNDLNLFFQIGYPSIVHKRADSPRLSYGEAGRPKCVQCKIGVFVGPEGGWTEEETKKSQSNGFTLVGLGNTVLRAETAATIASYLTANLC